MAGFGGGGAKSKNDKKNKKQKDTPIKLKPKLQWDRYSALKNADKAQVGIRLTNDDAGATSSDWLEVGRVKIKDNENIPLAVAIQRAIIAEVSSIVFVESVRTSTCTVGVQNVFVLNLSVIRFQFLIIHTAWQTLVSFASIQKDVLRVGLSRK
jgi:hypothetical protein